MDVYGEARKPEHSTLGDSAKRYKRDADAFTAGVQYALDRLVSSVQWARTIDIADGVVDYVETRGADILTGVHRGEL